MSGAGTYGSTFMGYIHRIRGYHSAELIQDKEVRAQAPCAGGGPAEVKAVICSAGDFLCVVRHVAFAEHC